MSLSSGDMNSPKLDNAQRQQIMSTVQQQLAIQNAQELLQKLSDKCFKMCISKPGSNLSNSEQKCISLCMDRYMDAWNIMAKLYKNHKPPTSPILSSTSLVQSLEVHSTTTTTQISPNNRRHSPRETTLRKIKSEFDEITVEDDDENDHKTLSRKRSRKFDNIIGITTRQTRTKIKNEILNTNNIVDDEEEENERYQHCEHCPLLYQLSPEQRQPSTTTISKKVAKEQKCNWDKCKRGLIHGSLFEHLMEHVQEQKNKHKEQQCLWVGCKVFRTPSKCANYLEKHIHKHTNEKPYRCVFDNCFEQFTTQNAVERHVQTHLKEADESALMNSGGDTDSIFTTINGGNNFGINIDNYCGDNGVISQQHQQTVFNSTISSNSQNGNSSNNTATNNKLVLMQQQTKINRKRKAAKVNGVPITYASNHDCFTDSETFHLNRLFESCPYISIENEDPTIILEPNITIKRQIGDIFENFVEWKPEGIYQGEWTRASHIENKKIFIQELNSEQLNSLLPPVYCYRPQPHRRKRLSTKTMTNI